MGVRHGQSGVARLLLVIASVCAAPGLSLSVYYLHLFDDAAWFYQFRSWPFAELTACGAGLLGGLLQARIVAKGRRLRTLVPTVLLAGLFVPYMKPLVAPLDLSGLAGECRDGVCLQSTPSTCGPASVASILRKFNVQASEKTIAREAFTSASGTEVWYLARAIRRHGFSIRYVVVETPVTELPVPSVVGVTLPGGIGHFISVLEETNSSYTLGDPMYGRLTVSKSEPGGSYTFTGFFMIVESPDT